MKMSDELHDAVLQAVQFDWGARTCRFDFRGAPGSPGPFTMTFSLVKELRLPAGLPWGPSASVLRFRDAGSGTYEFAMQSGDTITVVSAAEPPHIAHAAADGPAGASAHIKNGLASGRGA
jgi:hypothetical protein